MLISLFCGSFDPIHTGHAMVANYVSQSGVVDKLMLVPSRINPLKVGRPPVDERHRLEMCRLVAGKCCNVEASDVELGLPTPSYTYATLCHLRDTHPDDEFRLLVGSDNLLCFDRWRNYEQIIDEFGLIVYPRPGYEVDPQSLPANTQLLGDAPQALISSTFIREGFSKGMDLNFFLPDDVLDYIKNNNLYGSMH